MDISIRRTGGFAGIEEHLGTIRTERLSTETAARVHRSIAEISRMLDEEYVAPIGADMFRYEIDMTDERGKDRRLVIVDEGDDTSPLMKALYALLDAL